MTANVALEDLVVGDEILDLLCAGKVTAINALTRSDGREVGMLVVDLDDGGAIYGLPTRTVCRTREAAATAEKSEQPS